MSSTPEASDFVRREAVRRADDAKQLDDVLRDVLQGESARLMGERWLEQAVVQHVSLT